MAAVSVRLSPLGMLALFASLVIMCLYLFRIPHWFKTEQRVSMRELLSVSIDLARRGGQRVKAIREENQLKERVKGKTAEGADELVTEADLQSHRAIFYGFEKAFPGLRLISEEHETGPVDLKHILMPSKHLNEVNSHVLEDRQVELSSLAVWIDPLDATQEYTEDLREYVSVMVCVAVDGDPLIGVIHRPLAVDKTSNKGAEDPAKAARGDVTAERVQDQDGSQRGASSETDSQTYWAWRDHGFSANLKPQPPEADTLFQPSGGAGQAQPHRPQTGPPPPKKEKTVFDNFVISRSHAGQDWLSYYDDIKDVVNVTRAGGAGYKILSVLKGHHDVYLHFTLIKKWDLCAGAALLRAMDGYLRDFEGNDLSFSATDQVKHDRGVIATKNSNWLSTIERQVRRYYTKPRH